MERIIEKGMNMSIVYFPRLYEDELVYSVLARFYQQSGYSYYRAVAEDIYEDRLNLPNIEFINRMKKEILDFLHRDISMKELIEKHTMAPAYMRFISLEKRKRAIDLLVKMDKGYYDLMKVTVGEERSLCYCPECVQADREKYGESYWHRIHQIPGVKICPIHKCYLKNSNIRICSRRSPSLITIEELDLETDSEKCKNEVECKLANYIMNVFQMPLDFRNDTMVGAFFHSKLYYTKYVKKTGRIRKMGILTTDLLAYYEGIEWGISNQWQIQKIFDNHRQSLFEICQVAMFLGISEKKLVKMKIPSKNQVQEFEEKVFMLRQAGKGYRKIGKELGVSSLTVRKAGKIEKRKEIGTGGGRKGRSQEIDEELLPMVKDACHQIYGGGNTRPLRVNAGSVSRYIGKERSSFKKLPKCMSIINSFYETQEEYWVREVIWAAEQIKGEGKRLNMSRIGLLTNMRKRDFERCQTLLREKAPWIYTACFGKDLPY